MSKGSTLDPWELGQILAGLQLLVEHYDDLATTDVFENRVGWAQQRDDVRDLIAKLEKAR